MVSASVASQRIWRLTSGYADLSDAAGLGGARGRLGRRRPAARPAASRRNPTGLVEDGTA